MSLQQVVGRTILERVAEGEPAATRECLERFGPLVWSLARQLLADDPSAEDAVQEIFIEIWRCAGRYDPRVASQEAFVATIARRRLIDRRRRRRAALPTQELGLDPVASEDEGLGQVDLCDEARRAREVLARLEPAQRRVLELAVVQGLSHSEVSAHLGMPLGTVKAHVRRGLEKVRRALRVELDGPVGEGGR